MRTRCWISSAWTGSTSNGYVSALQTSGQLAGFLKNQRGYPVPSPAALGRIREAFIRAVDSYADANSIE